MKFKLLLLSLLLIACNDKKARLKQLITSDAMKTGLYQEEINKRAEYISRIPQDDAGRAKYNYDSLIKAQQLQTAELAQLNKTLDSLQLELNKN